MSATGWEWKCRSCDAEGEAGTPNAKMLREPDYCVCPEVTATISDGNVVVCDNCDRPLRPPTFDLDALNREGIELRRKTAEELAPLKRVDPAVMSMRLVAPASIPPRNDLWHEGALCIVFDGPPSHESGRFVEVETPSGQGVNAGEWSEREDGLWSLRIEKPGGAHYDAGTTRMREAGVDVGADRCEIRCVHTNQCTLGPHDGTRRHAFEGHALDGQCTPKEDDPNA